VSGLIGEYLGGTVERRVTGDHVTGEPEALIKALRHEPAQNPEDGGATCSLADRGRRLIRWSGR
jgi:hypothetical protein